MWSEYSSSNSNCFVFGFSAWEKRILISGIPKAIKKLKAKIEKINNDPKNEGQAIYWDKVRQLTNDISCLEDIQKTFLDDIERHNSKKPKKEWV